MATIPHYHNGTWTEAPAEEGQEGWRVIAELGYDTSLHVRVYVSPSGRFWLKLCQLADTAYDELVSAGALHDVFDLLGRWGPAVMDSLIKDELLIALGNIQRDVHAR